MLPYIDVLNQLQHPQYRSGEDLAKCFGVTRATIHNCIVKITAMGVKVERVRGKGYRLAAPVDRLNAAAITESLQPTVRDKLITLEVLQVVDSTNNYLANHALPAANHFAVAMAEMQTAGKGRRGRQWVSPYAANVYLSVLWPLQKSLSDVGGLSPLLSLRLLQALQSLGVTDLGVKWPNDVYCQHKKIAGMLMECSGEVGASSKMIIGVGINVHMSQQDNITIDQDWTDVSSHSTRADITRNEVTASVLNQLVLALHEFEQTADVEVAAEWQRWDILHNEAVTLHAATATTHGIARGIDEQGHLLFEADNALRPISAGDVSLRARECASENSGKQANEKISEHRQ